MTDALAVLRPAGRTARLPAAGKCRWNFLYSWAFVLKVIRAGQQRQYHDDRGEHGDSQRHLLLSA
jgi:hypothetical protein